MTKPEAIKEARIGALLHGVPFHVCTRTSKRKGVRYFAVEDSHYSLIRSTIIETFTPEKVRTTVPPEAQ
jgi:hypothetical protein